MMAGNPNWWSMHPPNTHHQPSTTLLSSSSSPSLFPSSSSFPFNSLSDSQEYPQSWSHLLLGGLPGEDGWLISSTPSIHYQPKKFENWEDRHHRQITNQFSSRVAVVDVKQEVPQTNNLYLHHGVGEFHQSTAWPQIMPPVSPSSCVTSLSSNNILDFSHTKPAPDHKHSTQQHKDHSSECNSTVTGGVSKKARVQASSSQPPLKVRKEKLGDRITALHQLVSPFGKTDTASVLLEAIGYIRFLQGQIEALSSPYLTTSSSANMRNQHCVQDINGAFPEDPGQLLNDTCLKRKGAPNQDHAQNKPKDLRSRGLCLVPVSCTDQQVGRDNDNGADYWAPARLGGEF